MDNERERSQVDEQSEATGSEASLPAHTGTCRNKDRERCKNHQETAGIGLTQAGFTAEYLYRCCDKSLQMELDRYQSLTTTATRLITCISIIAVAIMATASLLAPSFSEAGIPQILACFCLAVFAPLIGSLITALCSQFRFRYKALAFPKSFAGSVESYSSDFENAKEAALQYARTVEPCYESLRHRNEAIRRLLKASTICLLVTLGLIVGFSAIGCSIFLF